MHHPPPLPSELSKTRKFRPQVDAKTTPFVRVEADATVPFIRDSGVYERVELDLSEVQPIGDDTLPFALESAPILRVEPSEPYDLIEMRISVPAIAEPLRFAPLPQRAAIRPAIVIMVAVVLISAFASGVGLIFAL